jgi:hypothetical protein
LSKTKRSLKETQKEQMSPKYLKSFKSASTYFIEINFRKGLVIIIVKI